MDGGGEAWREFLMTFYFSFENNFVLFLALFGTISLFNGSF